MHVATPPGPGVAGIRAHGFAHHEVPLSRRGLNPVGEFGTLLALVRLMRRLRPGLVHLVTIKPILYGGIAARLCRVPAVVAAIAGLGFVNDPTDGRSRGLRRIILPLLRIALRQRNLRVVFQNPEDRHALVAATGLADEQTVLIKGSGVELDRYRETPEPPPPVTAILASRLLRTKGIEEFVAAARLLRERGLDTRFRVAGDVDDGNPLTISSEQLERWRAEGLVEFLGRRTDIAELFAAAHLVVLPSDYGEGLPRVLLEAAACGRAVVTTDHPGCRDAIEPGVTGLLVPPRNATALADAIEALARDPGRRRAMGSAGRALAEREFGIEAVVRRHLDIYAELVAVSRD